MPSFSIFQISADPLFNTTFNAIAEFSVDITDNDGTLSDPDTDGSEQFDTTGLPGALNSANTQVFEQYTGTAGGQPVEFILIRFSAPPLIVLTQGTLAPGQTLTGVSIADFAAPPITFVDLSTFVCFASTTHISTPDGPCLVANLRVGDRVFTYGGAVRPIRWIGRRTVLKEEIEANPKLRPVRISAGALGRGVPETDLLVSRQHRLLVSSKIAKRVAGSEDVLIAAIKLTGAPNIWVDKTIESIQYIHIAFAQHEVVFADGALAESFFIGDQARKSLPPPMVRQLEAINAVDEATPEPRFPIPSAHQQRRIVERHAMNRKCLQ